ncbi:MAG: hypothetical protein KatS3mg085_246 [Candidatus Dojkabacteria bacterium]|nr:MAG: hypothetical protein KatS3mg085_246 [Candidatus Dojkabacteria bacterium]
MAEFLLNDFCNRTKFVNQKAHSEYEHSFGQLIILNQTKPISTALEILYIDNPQDAEILKDDSKLDGIAKDLVESIYAYVQLTDEELEKLSSKQEAREIKPAIPLTDFRG